MNRTVLSVALLAAFTAAACSPKTAEAEADAGAAPMPVAEASDPAPADAAAPAVEQKDVVDTAIGSPDHTTLVSAVQAAGLVDTLKGAGPFTVFAPTNAAFEALPAGTVDTLLKPESKADLTAVLTYHVVPSRVERAQISLGKAVTTVQGGVFKVEAPNGQLTITDGRNRTSRITATDIEASNGVVHLVDRVLLPANRNIVETAQALPQFSILVEAVVAANLQGTLSGAGPLTVFAPTDDAFVALLAELGVSKAALLADTALLTKVLTYHVVPGRVLRADIPIGTPITTVQGQTLQISSSLVITDQRRRASNIVVTDVFATNGVVHAIDKVLLPA